MTEHQAKTPTTPKQFLAALLGGLFAPLLTIALIVGLVVSIQQRQVDNEAPATGDQAVRERVQPVGVSVAVSADAVKVARNGEQVYNGVCASCHGTGVLGAPKYQNAGDWSKRIAQGYETLLKHAVEGFNAMPARGGGADLTDVEVASAVVYMANAAGAKFKDAAVDTAAAAPPEASAQEGSAPLAAAAEQQVAAAKPAAAAPQAGRGGEEVYKSACAACHGTGVLGAPKYQDKAAWEKRIAQGYKVLLNHALNGFNSMPARGGVATLSDLEVADAVVYMANAAGASFKPTLP